MAPTGACRRTRGWGGLRIPASGSQSMIHSAYAQRRHDRKARILANTVGSPTPAARHRAVAARSTGAVTSTARRRPSASRPRQATIERYPVLVDGFQP